MKYDRILKQCKRLSISACIVLLWLSQETTGQTQLPSQGNNLPLLANRAIDMDVNEGTWLSLDVSPKGDELVFSMLGSLYTLPITGGEATRLTDGLALNCQPRYSPDGQAIAFISDRDGAENVWVLNLADNGLKQLSHSTDEYYEGLSWTKDGKYLIVAKGVGLPKLHLFPVEGGTGIALTAEPADLKAIEPTLSADDRYIWFSRRKGMWDYNAKLPQYQINTYDRATEKIEAKSSNFGSSFSPTPSPDGKWLVYGTRTKNRTALIIRNLETDEEKTLTLLSQRDDQESLASMGILPTMAFSPDSRQFIFFDAGKIQSITLGDGKRQEIPFRVKTSIDIGPQLSFKYPISDDTYFQAAQITDLALSPDARQAAFIAADHLYIMDYPNGKPRRLTDMEHIEFQPAWSNDGKSLAFATWDGQEGAIYKINLTAPEKPIKLTPAHGYFQDMVWSADDQRILFIEGTAFANRLGTSNRTSARQWLSWVPATGGTVRRICKTAGQEPHFGPEQDRIYLFSASEGLYSTDWEGKDERYHLKVVGPRNYSFSNNYGGEFQYFRSSIRAQSIVRAPKGDLAYIRLANDIYVVQIPGIGNKAKTLHLEDVKRAEFPAQKITEIGCEFPKWGPDGLTIYGALGSTIMRFQLKGKISDPVAFDELPVKLLLKRQQDEAMLLLSGARILTMEGKEVIEQGDILIKDNRILAVGAQGSLSTPKDCITIPLEGKTIVPGFIDVHAHNAAPRAPHVEQPPSYLVNLAYGVTTSRDPQPGVTDIFTYQDKVKTGQTLGPRIFTTGPGVGYWAYNIKDLDHARRVLKQYSSYYNSQTLKMYAVGNRKQRQWIIMAAKEQGLTPTTEGNLDIKLGISEILDGYPAHEHGYPISPIHKDFIKFVAQSGISVAPTFLVDYGGPYAENYFYSHEDPVHEEKMYYFMPQDELDRKTRRRSIWATDEEYAFPAHAAAVKQIADAGGNICIGAHGQLQGLGYHWEMWALGMGGMAPIDVLRAATINGAQSLGLDQDLGSIAKGKLADLLILDQNPLDDLRNTKTIKYVVIDGRVLDADNLGQHYPIKKNAPDIPWNTQDNEAGLP